MKDKTHIVILGGGFAGTEESIPNGFGFNAWLDMVPFPEVV